MKGVLLSQGAKKIKFLFMHRCYSGATTKYEAILMR